jgi:hypothetical protein
MRWFCVALLVLTSGCVQRRLTVKSDPPGALVSLNGDEIGRTPVTRDFTWYGTYDVELRHDGYETLKKKGRVIAPIWQWVPFDLLAELLPLTDRHTLSYRMHPIDESRDNPEQMLDRAQHLQGMLESSGYTTVHPSTSRPATRPATRATRPATKPVNLSKIDG